MTHARIQRTVGATCGRLQDEILRSIGKPVDNEIKKLSSVYENVSIAESVIMPSRVHMIILIANDNGRPKDAPGCQKRYLCHSDGA